MSISVQHFIDATGLICPEPIMLLHAAVRDANSGETLQLLATDPSTERDVRQFCEFLGHQLLDQKHEDGKWVHFIKKSD